MRTILVSMVMVIDLSTAANADALFPSIAAKASSEFPGWPVAHGIDASMSTCWSSSLHTSANNTEWYHTMRGSLKRIRCFRKQTRMDRPPRRSRESHTGSSITYRIRLNGHKTT